MAFLAAQLQQRGVNLVQVRRDYDSVCWPHAQQGFFKLKRQIPKLLCALGVEDCDDIVPRKAS